MNKKEILAKIKNLVTMNFSNEGEGEGTETKVEFKSAKFVVDEDGEEVEYEITYEVLEADTEVVVKKGEEEVDYSGTIEVDGKKVVLENNKIVSVEEVEENEEGSEDASEDEFLQEFSGQVLEKFESMNETLKTVVEKYEASEKENKELKSKVNELSKSVSKFSKQEVDNREKKQYTAEDFLKDPRIKY